jgi:hypothetical protein
MEYWQKKISPREAKNRKIENIVGDECGKGFVSCI